jgi:dTDP-4-amino-4,6-dideoxygalactose transaminase
MALARQHWLKVIEDCAHAIGEAAEVANGAALRP